MQTIYQQFYTSQEKEIDGFDFVVGEATFKIARAGGRNRNYFFMRTKKMASFRQEQILGTVDQIEMNRALAEVYAETVVKGWSNVRDMNGNEIPYTYENCVKLLLDLPDLFDLISDVSMNMKNYQDAVTDEMVKN